MIQWTIKWFQGDKFNFHFAIVPSKFIYKLYFCDSHYNFGA